jgi:hypothetical protein
MLTRPRSEELLESFLIGNERQQMRCWPLLQAQASELKELIWEELRGCERVANSWRSGSLLRLLAQDASNLEQIKATFPGGWLPAPTDASGLFEKLQEALLLEQLELADQLTSSALREMAGPAAVARGYVYFSEVANFQSDHLTHLDTLWWMYSNGRFGFRVQQRLLRSTDGDWQKLWLLIGWKLDGIWTRYPTSFDWSHQAPEGHMPLVNQLRGVRLLDAILNHPILDALPGSA